jgi:hypothetical protein
VIEVYQFYRSAIPATSFEILSIAFDEQSGQLFVKHIQRPKLRFTPGWIRVELPMLICFTLVKQEDDGEARFFIDAIEDFVQPMVSLAGFLLCGFGTYSSDAVSFHDEIIGGCGSDNLM